MKEIKKITISMLLCSMSIGCTHNRLSTREMLAMSNITSPSNSTMPIFVPRQLPTTPNNNMLQEPYQSLLKDMDDNMLLALPYGRQERSPNSRNKRDELEQRVDKSFRNLSQQLRQKRQSQSIRRILSPEESVNPIREASTSTPPTTSSADQAEKVENKTSLDEICKEHAAKKSAEKEQSIISNARTTGNERNEQIINTAMVVGGIVVTAAVSTIVSEVVSVGVIKSIKKGPKSIKKVVTKIKNKFGGSM